MQTVRAVCCFIHIPFNHCGCWVVETLVRTVSTLETEPKTPPIKNCSQDVTYFAALQRWQRALQRSYMVLVRSDKIESISFIFSFSSGAGKYCSYLLLPASDAWNWIYNSIYQFLSSVRGLHIGPIGGPRTYRRYCCIRISLLLLNYTVVAKHSYWC